MVLKKKIEILPQGRWEVPTFTSSASYLEALSRLYGNFLHCYYCSIKHEK